MKARVDADTVAGASVLEGDEDDEDEGEDE